ncbi:MAG: response regulator transcription factor [Acidaminococcaceae bacterium]
MRILFAEDDKMLGELVATMLKKAGFQVDWVERGDEAYRKVYSANYDLVILDWMLPGLSGIEICKCLREELYCGKLLLLTARDGLEDIVCGLNSGADDYLVKPFEFAELVARIKALVRRLGEFQPEEIRCGQFRLNRTEKTLLLEEHCLQLTPREFDLIDLLMRNKGQVLPREILIDRVWGINSEVTTNNLDAHIKLLRKKLATLTDSDFIKTVRGVGYKIEG